jgi:hypothetical protein
LRFDGFGVFSILRQANDLAQTAAPGVDDLPVTVRADLRSIHPVFNHIDDVANLAGRIGRGDTGEAKKGHENQSAHIKLQ